MDGGAWWATVHGVTKSRTRLSDFMMTTTSIKSKLNTSQPISRYTILKNPNSKFTSIQYSVQFSSFNRVQLFVTPWTAALQASLVDTSCWSIPKPMCIELVMPSNHLILCQALQYSQAHSKIILWLIPSKLNSCY